MIQFDLFETEIDPYPMDNQNLLYQGKCKNRINSLLGWNFRPLYVRYPYRKCDDNNTKPYPKLKTEKCKKTKKLTITRRAQHLNS